MEVWGSCWYLFVFVNNDNKLGSATDKLAVPCKNPSLNSPWLTHSHFYQSCFAFSQLSKKHKFGTDGLPICAFEPRRATAANLCDPRRLNVRSSHHVHEMERLREEKEMRRKKQKSPKVEICLPPSSAPATFYGEFEKEREKRLPRTHSSTQPFHSHTLFHSHKVSQSYSAGYTVRVHFKASGAMIDLGLQRQIAFIVEDVFFCCTFFLKKKNKKSCCIQVQVPFISEFIQRVMM